MAALAGVEITSYSTSVASATGAVQAFLQGLNEGIKKSIYHE
jgi:hypothetical protein